MWTVPANLESWSRNRPISKNCTKLPRSPLLQKKLSSIAPELTHLGLHYGKSPRYCQCRLKWKRKFEKLWKLFCWCYIALTLFQRGCVCRSHTLSSWPPPPPVHSPYSLPLTPLFAYVLFVWPLSIRWVEKQAVLECDFVGESSLLVRRQHIDN